MTADPNDGNIAAVDTSAQDQVIADIAADWEEAPPPVSVTGPIPVTTATAGTPGTYDPEIHDPVADAATLTGWATAADPDTAWTTGQHVLSELDAPIYWDGTGWVDGTPATRSSEATQQRKARA